jgi:hypothetical protein
MVRYANLQPWDTQDRYSTAFVIRRTLKDGRVIAKPVMAWTNDKARRATGPAVITYPEALEADRI